VKDGRFGLTSSSDNGTELTGMAILRWSRERRPQQLASFRDFGCLWAAVERMLNPSFLLAVSSTDQSPELLRPTECG
jgi:hypothetical protein